MNKYDSDYRTIPHVPFIIELPNLCYIVDVPICKAAQNEYLPYFDLVQVVITRNGTKDRQIKNVGHKILGFFASCSMFTVIGKDNFRLNFEPYKWNTERKSAIYNPLLSLNVIPATGYEAWMIYSDYKIKRRIDTVSQVVNDLNSDKIPPAYVRHLFPELIQEYERSRYMDVGIDFSAFEKAMLRHVLKEIPITKKKNREKLTELNLLVSYQFILHNQPVPKNKTDARCKAIRLFYPNITDDELFQRDEALKKKIKNRIEKSENISYLFPKSS